MPHVVVAKAMIEQGQQAPPGAVIEYVICQDDDKAAVAERVAWRGSKPELPNRSSAVEGRAVERLRKGCGT